MPSEEFEVFKNSPIREALLDIRTRFVEKIALGELLKFYERVKSQYPQKGERKSFESALQFMPVTSAHFEKPKTDGYILKSQAGNQIVQARRDGFTFNKLRPYDKWELFVEEAKKLWHVFVETVSPVAVTRIALRYINKIDIPLPLRDFEDYILTGFHISPNLPQNVNNFLLRFDLPMQEIEASAIITITIDKQSNPAQLPLIFDIDVIRNTNSDAKNEAIWEWFEALRSFKNQIFFESITEKAKELFR